MFRAVVTVRTYSGEGLMPREEVPGTSLGFQLVPFNAKGRERSDVVGLRSRAAIDDLAKESNPDDEGVSLSVFLNRVRGVIQHGPADVRWVRMEIRELRGKDGNWYLSVEERSPGGDVLAA